MLEMYFVGNEAADPAAKAATARHHKGNLLPYSDWYPSLEGKMFQKLKIALQIRNVKLKIIKYTPSAWRRLSFTRQE